MNVRATIEADVDELTQIWHDIPRRCRSSARLLVAVVAGARRLDRLVEHYKWPPEKLRPKTAPAKKK